MSRKFFLICFFVIIISNFSFAENTSQNFIDEKLKKLEERVAFLENKLKEQEECLNEHKACIIDQEKKITEHEAKLTSIDEKMPHRQAPPAAIEAAGFEVGAGGTIIVQGAINPNGTEAKGKDATDASYSADVTVKRDFENIRGRAFLHLEAGQGDGVEDDLIVFSNVNRDADNNRNVRVTELWYEQLLLDDKFSVMFGKLDPTIYFDSNEIANDETTQFLGRIFRNNPAIDFPDNTLGLRMAVLPVEWFEINYGAFNTNSDIWSNVFNNLFNVAQLNFKPKFMGYSGNYRFFGWTNNAYHTKWMDSDMNKKLNYGLGISFDQKVYDPITLFCRYGWQNPRVYNPNLTASDGSNYSVSQSWSAGLQIEGKSWSRENDILAFAVGQAIPSKFYKKADGLRKGESEGHLEAYYNIKLNKYLSITPDYQLVWNPFGKDVNGRTDPINIWGIRTQIDF